MLNLKIKNEQHKVSRLHIELASAENGNYSDTIAESFSLYGVHRYSHGPLMQSVESSHSDTSSDFDVEMMNDSSTSAILLALLSVGRNLAIYIILESSGITFVHIKAVFMIVVLCALVIGVVWLAHISCFGLSKVGFQVESSSRFSGLLVALFSNILKRVPLDGVTENFPNSLSGHFVEIREELVKR